MRRFILKISLFILTIFGLFILICLQVDGYADPFYKRFTSSKQKNLILGSSRSAQGVHPQILDSILNTNFYNYSFSVLHSPFGPAYLKSIKRKLDTNAEHAIYILAVDPWSLSSFTEDPEDSLSFRESNSSVINSTITNLNPNPLYLINNWKKEFYKVFSKKDSLMYLHDNGWLEVSIPMDSASVSTRIKRKDKMYRTELLPQAKFSETRLKYLLKTIEFLQNHGEVYLTRLPLDPSIMQIENELEPDFNKRILPAIALASGYLDLTDQNEKFQYTDGNHLYKESGEEVSKILGAWISEKREH